MRDRLWQGNHRNTPALPHPVRVGTKVSRIAETLRSTVAAGRCNHLHSPSGLHSFTATHLSGPCGRRRSWHLFEVVSLDGCPGFQGPYPPPVSMSGGKSRGRAAEASRKSTAWKAANAVLEGKSEPVLGLARI